MSWRTRWLLRHCVVSVIRNFAALGRCYLGPHDQEPDEIDPFPFHSSRFLDAPPPGHPERLVP
ncbi:DUF6059 family protein [Streptomyces sp. NPDC023838]|uniref:DUF6059 family protein n=1 Tax=Streptomyces sp. NPDC023838 TaxID=3154325 RepID=UPI0033F5AFEB